MDPRPGSGLTGVQRSRRAAHRGLFVNAAMMIVKIVTGILGNSYALIADGVESTLDIFSSLIVVRGVSIAGRGPDDRYHFGYGKAEPVAAAAVALMLLVAALGISVQAVREILVPHHAPAPFTLVVLLAVVAVKEGLFRHVLSEADAVGSIAVRADAWHHRSDAITSLAAAVGISVALIGGEGWEAADDWGALLASAVIAWNGLRLLRPALADLMDRAPDPMIVAQVKEVAEGVTGVLEVERIFMRRAGVGYFAALHVHADPQLPLREAHAIGHKVKDVVQQAMPEVIDVLVHMEPAGGHPH